MNPTVRPEWRSPNLVEYIFKVVMNLCFLVLVFGLEGGVVVSVVYLLKAVLGVDLVGVIYTSILVGLMYRDG